MLLLLSVDRSCSVKYVKNVNVTLSGLFIPVSLLSKINVEKFNKCSHTLSKYHFSGIIQILQSEILDTYHKETIES